MTFNLAYNTADEPASLSFQYHVITRKKTTRKDLCNDGQNSNHSNECSNFFLVEANHLHNHVPRYWLSSM